MDRPSERHSASCPVDRAAQGWRVLNVELPRFDREGKELFIDILASCGSIVTVIECKKAHDRSYVFSALSGPR
jgi:hypothetical protein